VPARPHFSLTLMDLNGAPGVTRTRGLPVRSLKGYCLLKSRVSIINYLEAREDQKTRRRRSHTNRVATRVATNEASSAQRLIEHPSSGKSVTRFEQIGVIDDLSDRLKKTPREVSAVFDGITLHPGAEGVEVQTLKHPALYETLPPEEGSGSIRNHDRFALVGVAVHPPVLGRNQKCEQYRGRLRTNDKQVLVLRWMASGRIRADVQYRTGLRIRHGRV